MARLLILLAIVVFLFAFIRLLKKHLARDNKIEELREVKLEGDLMDIDKEIAKEKARQKIISSEIDDISSKS